MNKQSQYLFEAPVTSEATHYTNPYADPEFYNPEWKAEWELQEGSNYSSPLGEEGNNRWPSDPYTALEFEAEWELSGGKPSKKLGKVPWPQTLLPLLNRYRGNIPLDFLLGWIAIESNGKIGVVTAKLDERGYFQIHPAESKTLRLDHRRLSTDPDYSVKGGIQLVQYNGKIAQNLYKLQFGSDLFWGIVKLRHWLPGGVNIILKDVRERGFKPTTWKQFKQYVIDNYPRLYQRFKTELKKKELPTKWDPKYGIDVVDRMFKQGRQLAKDLSQTNSGSKSSSSPSSRPISPQVGNIPEVHLLSPGAIGQRVKQLLDEGVFNLSLLGRFASGQIWNEDHLALEILFHRQPQLRPTHLDTVSSSKRLPLLRSLAVKHQRELMPIRERIVRPIFGNPANFQVGSAGNCQIRDLREEVRKLGSLPGGKTSRGVIWYKRDAKSSPRKQEAVDSIVLHHMAYNIGNDVNSYKKVGAHYIVTADGQIAQLYNDLDFLNASNGFNPRSVAIEFAGNFSDNRYHWWKSRELAIPDRCYLTPTQIRAGRCLLATLKARFPGIKYLYAHRQSSQDRSNDPGPDIWFNVGEFALRNLNLTDQLLRTYVGKGQPIPENWRRSR